MAQNEKPVHEVRLGKVKAAIWRNENDSGTRYGVTFSRIYKTDDGWESSSSFGRDELPLLGKVADMAHTWIYQQSDRGESEPDRNPRAKNGSESRQRNGSR
ncbi:hypothetical protein SH449x_000207 [Pirellulaceae bacterium SH449]